jgi:hypothetical protein
MHPITMERDDSLESESVDCQLRSGPLVHPPVDAIACGECQRLDADVTFFDPQCAGCQELLYDESTSIPEMFAILRQWTPRTQHNAEMIIRQVDLLHLHDNCCLLCLSFRAPGFCYCLFKVLCVIGYSHVST